MNACSTDYSKKFSRRLRRMESYKQMRNAINLLPSRPPEEEQEEECSKVKIKNR